MLGNPYKLFRKALIELVDDKRNADVIRCNQALEIPCSGDGAQAVVTKISIMTTEDGLRVIGRPIGKVMFWDQLRLAVDELFPEPDSFFDGIFGRKFDQRLDQLIERVNQMRHPLPEIFEFNQILLDHSEAGYIAAKASFREELNQWVNSNQKVSA